MMKTENIELQKQIDELYRTNFIFRACVQAGRELGDSQEDVLAKAVLCLAEHNNNLQDALLKMQMESQIIPMVKP